MMVGIEPVLWVCTPLEDLLSRSMSYKLITSTYMKVELALFSDINRVLFELPM